MVALNNFDINTLRFLWLQSETEIFPYQRRQRNYTRFMTKKQESKMNFFKELINSGTTLILFCGTLFVNIIKANIQNHNFPDSWTEQQLIRGILCLGMHQHQQHQGPGAYAQ